MESQNLALFKEKLHNAIDGVKATDNAVYISGDLSDTTTPISIICGGERLDACALLTVTLAELIAQLDKADANMVRSSVICTMLAGKEKMAELLNDLKDIAEEVSE